jgi:hypothetical protein
MILLEVRGLLPSSLHRLTSLRSFPILILSSLQSQNVIIQNVLTDKFIKWVLP